MPKLDFISFAVLNKQSVLNKQAGFLLANNFAVAASSVQTSVFATVHNNTSKAYNLFVFIKYCKALFTQRVKRLMGGFSCFAINFDS